MGNLGASEQVSVRMKANADASLYWLAVETGTSEIMTVDIADFSRYRLPNSRFFSIL